MTDRTHWVKRSLVTFIDRYRQVGLERNPFAASMEVDAPIRSFVDRGLADPPPPHSGILVQVIGESGWGKSTQVLHWREATPGPYHYIPRAPYRLRWGTAPMPEAGVVYGDEIDRMPVTLRRRWFTRLAKQSATAVIGTHADLTRVGRAAGFHDVVTHWLSPLGEDELGQLLRKRLAEAATTPDHIRFSCEDIETILSGSDGIPGEADVIAHRLLAERVEEATRLRHGKS